jgi:flavin-dependent dehydrogenase
MDVDAVILGGGPAGCACALALARRSRRVIVVERATTVPTPGRLETLAPSVQLPLRALGAWDAFQRAGFTPCWGIHSSWATVELDEQDFSFHPYGHAWTVDRSRFALFLQSAFREAEGRLLVGAISLGIVRNGARWRNRVQSGDGRTLEVDASVVVDATGRGAWAARTFGVRREIRDALVVLHGAHVAACGPSVLTLEAAEDGWWFTLPMEGRRFVAFVTDTEVLAGRSAPEAFREFLLRTDVVSALVTGAIEVVRGARAEMSRLIHPGGSGWVAVGDAAIARDPLSGSGCLAAVRDGLAAAESIDAFLAGDDGALDRRAGLLSREWMRVLDARRDVYQLQRRHQSGFWSRRSTAVRPVSRAPATSAVRPVSRAPATSSRGHE